MTSLIFTSNTVVWALTLLLALVATAVKRKFWPLNFRVALASTSIWGSVALGIGAPVWPYIAYAILLLLFYFEAFILAGLVNWRREEAKGAKKEGDVHAKKEP